MQTYKTSLSIAARKELDRLDHSLQSRIVKKLKALESNPRPHGAIKMTGISSWRIRVGDYRIIYDIEDQQLIVIVIKIGHRREIYR